jgi:hypothetical protein
MNIEEHINKYITSHPEPKRSEMQELHRVILQVMPACKLWFLDGKNSANKTGISVYILVINDKTYLAKTFGKKIGKASVSGYCIKFKTLKDINTDILEEAIRFGVEAQNEKGELKRLRWDRSAKVNCGNEPSAKIIRTA